MERIVQGLSDNDLQDHLVRGIADQDILADPLGDEGILLLIPPPKNSRHPNVRLHPDPKEW